MAGTLFENNLSPYLTVVEQGSTPATPSAGDQRLFIRTSDHVLCYVNSSGTVSPVAAGGGSGSITASGYTQNTARLLGRTTASAGAIEEITVGTGLSLSAGSLTATGSSPGVYGSYTRSAGDYSTSSTTFVDIDGTNWSFTKTFGAHVILCGFRGAVLANTGTNDVFFEILLDGANQSSSTGGLHKTTFSNTAWSNVSFTHLISAVSAGSHTIKIQWKVSANTITLAGNTTQAGFFVAELPDA